MSTFTDNSRRTWTVQVNVETIRRVRAMVEVDLLDAAGGDLPARGAQAGVLERLITDPVLLCDVLHALCKEQAGQQWRNRRAVRAGARPLSEAKARRRAERNRGGCRRSARIRAKTL